MSRIENNFLRWLQDLEVVNSTDEEFATTKSLNILVQAVEDYFFLIKFYLYYKVKKRKSQKIKIYFIKLSDPLLRRGTLSFLKNSLMYDLKWMKMYTKLFDGEYIFSFSSSAACFNEYQKSTALNIFNELSSKKDVLNIKYKDFGIGSMVYDYYLRVESCESIDITSEVLFEIILNAIRTIDEFIEICEKKKITHLLTSYVSYTPHGIPALVCLSKGASVLSFSPVEGAFCKKVSGDFFSHARDYPYYKDLVKNLSQSEIDKGKILLESRFHGVIDPSISYMKNSSYVNTKDEDFAKFTNQTSVVIYLHCFYDSPHIYRSMLFADFYEWLIFTLNELSLHENLNIFLKKHPNGLEGNEQIVTSILKKFPRVKTLDSKVSNLKIAHELKPKAILTVYGTIAYEMAYLGLPVFCAGDNPHVDFNFQYTFKEESEYGEFLRDIFNPKYYDFISSNEAKETFKNQVGAFLFLHTYAQLPNFLGRLDSGINNELITLFKANDLKIFLKSVGGIKKISV